MNRGDADMQERGESIAGGQVPMPVTDGQSGGGRVGDRRWFVELERANDAISALTGEAQCLWGLATIALMQDEHETARGLYEEARELYKRAGGVTGEADCLSGLAEIALMQDEHETARGLYEEARELYKRAGSLSGVASCDKVLKLLQA